MKVLLVRPPHPNPRLATPYANEPLSLETVAGAADGHDVHLLDMQFDPDLRGTLGRIAPDVVGTGGYTADVPGMVRVLSQVKHLHPRAFTVVGGHHATLSPQSFNRSDVDAVVLGMGEVSFAELLRALERRADPGTVAGLALPDPAELRFTAERPLPPSLDHIPPPRRDLTRRHWGRYRALGRRIGVVNTAKGCPYRCRFCSIAREMRGRYITKHPDRVVAELASMPQRLVRFADGNTFGSGKRVRTLHDAIRGARLEKRFLIDARPDTVARNPSLFERWREAGLTVVALGLEGIHPERLAALGKGSTVDDNLRALSILRDLDIKVLGQFMIDPDFSEDDFRGLLDFVLEQRIPFPSFTITTPFPGTPLFDERRAEIALDDLTRFDCFHALLPTRLGERRFYERFLWLYGRSYGGRRLAAAALDRIRRPLSSRELPLSVLLAIRLYLVLGLRGLRREYGLT
jgi:radical SAM superfamily enzyme YgiQ (UPF0313 family)